MIRHASRRTTDFALQLPSPHTPQLEFFEASEGPAQASETDVWHEETLQDLLQTRFQGREIIVVSNREPCMHTATPEGIQIQRPASGLVTALESVVSACSGSWIAHGSGSADRQSCDRAGRLGVPADNPRYILRRLWLDKQEEKGYYQGFSNEGLWPLCHVAHVRPRFSAADWETYKRVNARFADAVIEEADTENPVVLVQDYHLALVPQLIRSRLPAAIILTFWHIPWPTPDAFSICPWRQEIVDGLLGSTTIGFQTLAHCEHFLESAERLSSGEVDHRTRSVGMDDRSCRVAHYPISIPWPEHAGAPAALSPACRNEVFDELGLVAGQFLLLGVDRLDYTKGIEEKFLALERLLEQCAHYRGRLTLLQIAAPTRCDVEAYRLLEERVLALAIRINARFSHGGYRPIILKHENCDAPAIDRLYRACDVCLVTSLHDGMNLVAKEFVAARHDAQGALVLSEFAGAAFELSEALIVNPYHLDQVSNAILQGIEMQPTEQALRMQRMRAVVRESNVYRWAGRMLADGLRFEHYGGDRRRKQANACQSAAAMAMCA